MQTYYKETTGGIREVRGESAMKLALARDPLLRLRKGFRVRVPRGTKRVFIPRKNHANATAFTMEHDEKRLHRLGDDLEPCIVRRGAFGYGLHQCSVHVAVYIEEINK